jgi:hypothetical protein
VRLNRCRAPLAGGKITCIHLPLVVRGGGSANRWTRCALVREPVSDMA